MQHLVHPLDKRECHALFHLGRDVAQVLLVRLREDHLAQARSIGSQYLLLHAADLQHLAAQRHLTGHRDVAPHWTPAEAARDRQRQSDTGARSVFGNCARGEVNVQIVLSEVGVRNCQLSSARSHVRVRGIDALAHDFTKLARNR